MSHAIGALLLLIGIIVLIKYIMRTGEKKSCCSIQEDHQPEEQNEINDNKIAEVGDIEIDIKEEKTE